MNICLVTPDLVGPIKNGGIGTYSMNLARLLRQAGHELTIVFTSTVAKDTDRNWRCRYEERGITLVSIVDLPKPPPAQVNPQWERFMEHSWQLYHWLKTQSFELIHFQDLNANGFCSIQAKATAHAFENTHLCVTLHSPTQWCTQGMAQWPDNSLTALRLQYSEKFCAEHADHVISPSHHMLDWVRNRGWLLNNQSLCLQNPFLGSLFDDEPVNPDTGHVIYFGRLESRKGICLFCEALNVYVEETDHPAIKKVTFVGKEMLVENLPAADYIQNAIGHSGVLEIQVLKDLDTFSALKYIKDSKGIVIIPSLLDNFPYALVECIVQGIPVWSSNAGGMNEICDPDKLFHPSSGDLRRVFKSLESQWVPSRHRYDPLEANRKLTEWHEDLARHPASLQSLQPDPVISIVIAYYNHAEYLEDTLNCLLQNDLSGHEVIVINDGSTEKDSNRVFESLSQDIRFSAFHFLNEKQNRGLGGARNYGVSKASGDWLLFHDSDNCAMATMISSFKKAMVHSSADILTCHNQSFKGSFPGRMKSGSGYTYRPYGDFTVLGLMENVFGDANFAVRRKIFEELGGFTRERSVYEDWHFFLKAAMEGKRNLVIPEVLYWYRKSEQSMSRKLNSYSSHLSALQPYLKDLDPVSRELLTELTIPLYLEHKRLVKALRKIPRGLRKALLKLLGGSRISRTLNG